MNLKTLLMAALAALALGPPVLAGPSANDLSVYAATRFETHTLEGTKSADNALTSSLTVLTNTGAKSTVMASFGYRLDMDDNESDSLALGLGYLHTFNKNSSLMAGYSNYKSYESLDDGTLQDTADMFYFTHAWKVVKRDTVRATLFTSLSADTAFDDNRMLGETLSVSGPYGAAYRWGASYQLGYSLVDHRHSVAVWDVKVSRAEGAVSVGRRYTAYLNSPGTDVNDNSWILAYSHRLR